MRSARLSGVEGVCATDVLQSSVLNPKRRKQSSKDGDKNQQAFLVEMSEEEVKSGSKIGKQAFVPEGDLNQTEQK